MMRWVGLGLLGIGAALAAAFGARNGLSMTYYRQMQWPAQEVGAASDAAWQAQVADVEWPDDESPTVEGLIAVRTEAAWGPASCWDVPRELVAADLMDRGLVADTRVDAACWLDDPEGLLAAPWPPYQALDAGETVDEAAVRLADRAAAEGGLPEPGTRFTEWLSAGAAGWGVGVLLIGVGAVLARRGAKQAARDLKGGGSDFLGSLRTARARLVAVADQIAELPMDQDAPEAREELDAVRIDVLDPVVEARQGLIDAHGIAGFAEFFGPFSAAERNLGRTWSALTDEHAEAAREALARCLEELSQAETAYQRVARR